MNIALDIQLIAVVTAIACAIPGVFLVLRRMALVSDAISHSILPGLVIGFFLTHDLNSPWLIAIASFTGVLTVVLVEKIHNTRLVKEDTAIGLVFPTLFSIGVILISLYASDVHLDTDAVLLGDLALSSLDRLIMGGKDIGPKSLYVIGTIALTSLTLLIMFYKELKISTFDRLLAASLGFSPVVIHYGLMTIASVTTVGAFDAVGAVLVVALMIAPAATVYLFTDDLKRMIVGSVVLGISSAIAGYWLSRLADANVAGSIVAILGLLFLLGYLFSPKFGIVAVRSRRRRQRREVFLLTFLLHLKNHSEAIERRVEHMQEHIDWTAGQSKRTISLATENGFVEVQNDVASLTPKGRDFTDKAIDYITDNKESSIEGLKEQYFLFRG